MPAVPDVAGVPSAEDLAALPHDELAARLAEAYRVIAGLTARVEPVSYTHLTLPTTPYV